MLLINAYQIFLEEYLGKSIINFLSFLKKETLGNFKDGIPSYAIEGEPSHLEINSIFSSSMPILNVFEPISKPILDPNKSFYAPSAKLHNDPRNPSRHPKNRSHENYRNTQEEQRQ